MRAATQQQQLSLFLSWMSSCRNLRRGENPRGGADIPPKLLSFEVCRLLDTLMMINGLGRMSARVACRRQDVRLVVTEVGLALCERTAGGVEALKLKRMCKKTPGSL